MNKPLILTAMELEARALARRLAAHGAQFDIQVIGLRACRLRPPLPEGRIVIVAGLAGALDSRLKIGDIVSGDEIYTSDRLISTPQEKSALFHQTGKRAVDMETEIVRRAAPASPILAIRAISDAANESVDVDLFRMVGENGRVRRLAAAAILLRRPALISQARRMRFNTNIALESLAAAIRQRIA